MSMIISIVVAADEQNGIGVNNALLCHLPADLKYFRKITTGHCVIMGRKTFESVGRPLPNRTNIVVSRNQELTIEGCIVVHSVEEAVEYAKQQGENELMVIGGGVIFTEVLASAHKIYLTRIHHTFKADTFLPEINKEEFRLISAVRNEADEKNAYPFTFEVWERTV